MFEAIIVENNLNNMKNIKTVFQALYFIVCILIFTNCQGDKIEENQEQLHSINDKFPYSSSLVYKEHLEANSKLNHQIMNLGVLKTKTNTESIDNALYDFSISLDAVCFIESVYDNSHSYTFMVKRENSTENVLETLVFSYDPGIEDYMTSLITYHFSEAQKKEFLLTQHVRTPYEVSSEFVNLDLSEILSKNSMPLPCTTNFSVYHITPEPNSNTFLQSSTIGNVHNDCENEDVNGETECTTYTVVTYDCPDGGSANVSSGTATNNSGTAGGGGSSENNFNDSQPIITTPLFDLGDWLIEKLGVINLNASSDDQAIANWIENNDQPGNELFYDVYRLYFENELAPNINEIIRNVISILDADPIITLDEALEAYFLINPTDIIIDDDEPVIENIEEELECFDLNIPAQLTIYVEQSLEGSRQITANIGHAFVGIQQGGITRNVGFYPEAAAASLLSKQDSKIKDNSNSPYHVSITINISPSQLTDVINYIKNYPQEYDLNNYNCVDFAIQTAGQGGLIIPSTVGEYGVFFKGRNPSDMGEDMRELSLPLGSQRDTNGGNAPLRSPDC